MPPPAKFITDLTGCQRHLHAFLSSVVWNIADADEILQETNLALWQKADEFDPSRPFLPWAMAFAQMQVKAWLKRQKRVPIVFDDRLLEQMATEALEESAEMDAMRRALADCLQRLSAGSRDLIATRYEPDAKVNDLAAAHKIAPKALSERLRRIRAKWKPGTKLTMDLGYVFGNAQGANKAVRRAYLFNNSFSANIVDDIPNESRLEPQEWGEATVE